MTDHVEFKPTFLGDVPSAKDTWVLSATCTTEGGVSIRRLTPEDLVKVMALPELQRGSVPWLKVVQELCERVTSLQGGVPAADLEDWSPVVELFHPDMNISDIQHAVHRLLEVYAMIQRLSVESIRLDNNLPDTILRCKTALWEGRATQLEKDQGVSDPEPVNWRAVAATRALTAEILWQKLDDIDTLSDQIKPDDLAGYRRFYEKALDIAKKRHVHLKSDGHTLTWPDGTVTKADIAERYSDLVDCVEHLTQGYAFETEIPEHQAHAKLLRELFNSAHAALQTTVERPTIELLLHCPMCNERHIDVGKWAIRQHHTHSCQKCGHTWRPAKEATVGVQFLEGFKNEPDAVDGEALVGKPARCIDNSVDGTIVDYNPDNGSYRLRSSFGTKLWLKRHEFTVLE